MKRVMMTREKLYKTEEFEVDPNEPDIVLDKTARFGNESDEGFWNEYYRVGIVDTDDEIPDQVAMFSETAQDFYNRADAQACYSEMAERVKMENIEAELKSREDVCGVDKATLRERYC